MKKAVSTIQIDNELIRVTRWDFAPNTETGLHTHELNYVVVPITDGTLIIKAPDGQSSNAKLSAGQAYTRLVGTEHNVINNSGYDVSFVEVEIK